ncbi:MAG TPA: hypothetical protein VKT77_15215, partial [Chthonomonadaceae bacterium]|nr:hypothetical protein [Chthonomonadaceae bacterium]
MTVALTVVAAALVLAVMGIGAWCGAGVVILLRRSVYPVRVTPRMPDSLRAAGGMDVRFPAAGDGPMLSGWYVPAARP